MNRLLGRLLGVACVLLVLALFFAYRLVPQGKTPFAKAQEKAGRFVVVMAKERVELKKESGVWKVVLSSGSAVAEPMRLTSFLSSLEGIKLEDVISDSPAQAPLFEVTDTSGTHVTVWDSQGKTLADGLFGKQAPDFTHLYFRFADRPQVYLASGLFRGELNPGRPEDWKKEKAEKR